MARLMLNVPDELLAAARKANKHATGHVIGLELLPSALRTFQHPRVISADEAAQALGFLLCLGAGLDVLRTNDAYDSPVFHTPRAANSNREGGKRGPVRKGRKIRSRATVRKSLRLIEA